MKTIISLIIAFGILAGLPSATWAEDKKPSKIQLKPKEGTTKKEPQMPAYIPLYCTVAGGMVTVYCEYDAMGVVTVTDAESGSLIASASGMLGEGIMIMLPADRGAVRIEVEMNGTTYYCVI